MTSTTLNHIYVDGAFVEPHGTELADLFDPSTEERIGRVRLGDHEDALRAIAAATRAFPAMSRTGKDERIAMLDRLHAAVSARVDDIRDAMMREYGFKQSGLGREFGEFGLEAFLEPRTIVGARNL